MKLILNTLLTATLMAGGLVTSCLAAERAPGKKIIEYGGDRPAPSFVRDHIEAMENNPFDGVIMRLPGYASHIFIPAKLDDATYGSELKALGEIRTKKFTDNFILIQSTGKLDWFNDSEWAIVLDNLRTLARAARGNKSIVGFCFDPEQYGDRPFVYKDQAQAKVKSKTEMQAQVRKRGADFMKTLQQEWPGSVLHTFFLFSEHLPETFPDTVTNVPERMAGIEEDYEMLPDFANGLVETWDPKLITLTDGNENSYYYKTVAEYRRSDKAIRHDALRQVDPKNAEKYSKNIQVSEALYFNFLFNMLPWDNISGRLSQDERVKWLEFNTYHALNTADEYVWCYTEKMSWWAGDWNALSPRLSPQGRWNIPDPRVIAAIESARRKIKAKRPLGFDLGDILARANKQAAQLTFAKSAQSPVIDGKLTEAVWASAAAVPGAAMVGFDPAKTGAPKTEARVTWDDKALYIGVKCQETAAVLKAGKGNWVEIFLQPQGSEPNYHFLVSPRNDLRQEVNTTDNAHYVLYSPSWGSATQTTKDGWTAEVAIPWANLRIDAPTPGRWIRGNVIREKAFDDESRGWKTIHADYGFPEVMRMNPWTFK